MARNTTRSRGCQSCRQRKVKCDEQIPECYRCLQRGIKCPGVLIGTLFIDMSKAGKRTLMASNSVKLSTLTAERNLIYSRTGGQDTIASEARIERDETSESQTDEEVALSSSTMASSILPTVRNGSSIGSTTIPPKKRKQQSITSQGQAWSLPTSHQPSRAAAFQSLFLTHFIEFYWNSKITTKRISWVHQLPQLVANPPTLAVKYCIRATSMAIYGQLTNDKSIQWDSHRWYILGLGHQRNSVRRMTAGATGTSNGTIGGGGNPGGALVANDDDISLIFAALLFIHFEICMRTRPNGWVAHAAAAENFLLTIGPHACRTHQMHAIFISIRMYSFYLSIHFNRPSLLASEEWCTIPFEYIAKSPFDKLLTICFQVPLCLALYTQMEGLSPNNTRSGEESNNSNKIKEKNKKQFQEEEELKQRSESKCHEIIAQLDIFWQNYSYLIKPDYDYSWYSVGPWHSSYRNPEAQPCHARYCVSSLIGHFDSAKIILYSLLLHHAPASSSSSSPQPPPCSHKQQQQQQPITTRTTTTMRKGMGMGMGMMIPHAAKGAAFWQKQVLLHSASVLAGMLYHESSDTVTSGRFALVFPLGLVAVYSPEEEQRREARMALVRWGVKG